MLDPFPSPPQWVVKAITPVASFLNLPTLPLHFHEIILAVAFYQWLYLYGSPAISKRLIPSIYASFNKRTQINWDIHIVSFVQSLLVCSVALWLIFADAERSQLDWQGRVFGYTGATGVVQAFGAGYFLWDFFMCIKYFDIFGVGMLAHAVSAMAVYFLGFRPFVNYYAPIFVLYELSSPFLNIHWACDKLNLSGSIYQLINGIVLVIVFFGARLCYGTYQSFLVAVDIYNAMQSSNVNMASTEPGSSKHTIPGPSSNEIPETMRYYTPAALPIWLPIIYVGSNVVLTSLNWYWFGKMITTIKARFDPNAQRIATQKQVKNHEAGQATSVQAKEAVRKRRA